MYLSFFFSAHVLVAHQTWPLFDNQDLFSVLLYRIQSKHFILTIKARANRQQEIIAYFHFISFDGTRCGQLNNQMGEKKRQTDRKKKCLLLVSLNVSVFN